MRVHNRIGFLLAALALAAAAPAALEARTRKGDKLLAQGRKHEQKKDWDKALELYEQALAEDAGDSSYLIGVRRVRFQAGQAHVDRGQRIRGQGNLQEALAEFEKAFATDPASAIAQQPLMPGYRCVRFFSGAMQFLCLQ